VTIAVDVIAVLLAGVAAYTVRECVPNLNPMSPANAAWIAVPGTVVSIAIAVFAGLYRSAYRAPYADQYREAAKAYAYSALIVYIGMYLVMGKTFPPRFTLMYVALIPLFFGFGRLLLNMANRSLQRKGHGQQSTMIMNWYGAGAQLFDRFAIFPELGYSVQAFACTASDGDMCDPASCTFQQHFAFMKKAHIISRSRPIPCYALGELEEAIDAQGIECIFSPLAKPMTNAFSDIVHTCIKTKVKLKVISRESEEVLRFSRVHDLAGISLYSPPKRRMQWIKARLKRVFDFCGSSLLIVICLPIFALVALAILLEDGGPVLFQQRRAAMKGGRFFNFLKFRSMVKGAETQQAALNRINQTEEGLFLLKNDPRITRVGWWIRRLSIDELPQLFNVFRGEMSLVGPRPLTESDLENISAENEYAGYYYLREKTLPGMTGLWQICGRRDVPFRQMVLLDLYYIENQSIAFDLEILFATIPVVLFGRGAY
jgi:exopolysaccharide biosynthesis polyprenyl glycosylphosphotransferase